MILKNKKAIVAILTAALATNAILPVAASAASSKSYVTNPDITRTKAEAFGDDTYANRFLSLYDDVVTNGLENGYLSKNNVISGGFGVPYHSIEEVIVEAPDYGHETTSEAVSYLVWVAAMRDNLAKKDPNVPNSNDLAKAWKTMEVMIPKTQTGFMRNTPSATYNDEWQDPTKYPTDMMTGNNGVNPIHQYFSSAYGSDTGLYLMHWLGDVDNWYGFGEGKTFTFINTFQRGEQESCFETVPHPSIETLKYGNSRGLVGIFSTEPQPAAQWRYTNAPDAEDRAIQAVYWANKWGVGDASISSLAGKMGDQTRNNMFDKYYKAMGCQNKNSPTTGYESAHYLMSWYTSWGGAIDGAWTWQIGASHVHQFYQNPMAAYALLNDSQLTAGMKAQNAVKDYETSLNRQLDFYLWLQSSTGPIAGGATNSWNGRYETYPAGVSTFNQMAYVEHPVYADPGSNHWIGNQTWAMQRIAELYYVAKNDGNTEIANKCKRILDKWIDWAVKSTKLNEDAGDAGYAIPANLDWNGQPDPWTGTPSENTGLTATIRNYTSSDIGSIASWANTLIYYAKASGATAADATADSTTLAGKALYIAKTIMDNMWDYARDDLGLSVADTNGSLVRIFEQEVHVPSSYVGTMPNGDQIKSGIKFIDIRTMYRSNPDFQRLEADYKATGTTENTELRYHRFWHEADIMMALGALAELYPDLTPPVDEVEETLKLDKTEISLEVGETEEINSNVPGTTWKSADPSVASVDKNGVVTGESAGKTTITATTPGGQTATVTVIVKEVTTTTDIDKDKILYGDVNVDGEVRITDIIEFNKYLIGVINLSPIARENANCVYDNKLDVSDNMQIAKYLVEQIPYSALGPQNK
jgi:hypothetical protein